MVAHSAEASSLSEPACAIGWPLRPTTARVLLNRISITSPGAGCKRGGSRVSSLFAAGAVAPVAGQSQSTVGLGLAHRF